MRKHVELESGNMDPRPGPLGPLARHSVYIELSFLICKIKRLKLDFLLSSKIL